MLWFLEPRFLRHLASLEVFSSLTLHRFPQFFSLGSLPSFTLSPDITHCLCHFCPPSLLCSHSHFETLQLPSCCYCCCFHRAGTRCTSSRLPLLSLYCVLLSHTFLLSPCLLSPLSYQYRAETIQENLLTGLHVVVPGCRPQTDVSELRM